MKNYILLYIAIFIYSLQSVMSKLASDYTVFHWQFAFFYTCGLLCLAIYAVLWQQILKSVSLITAYANRSLVMILTMLWGLLLFNEQITINMVIGAAIILVGVNLVVQSSE